MRVRAHQLGRRLAFREVAPVTVTGHRGLLREAMLELLENALRHGDAAAPVEIGVEGGVAPRIVVASTGAPFSIEPPTGASTGELAHHGLGLTIVRWIVELHRGKLALTTQAGSNEVAISFPPG
jgi:signal transduction histidine kinase